MNYVSNNTPVIHRELNGLQCLNKGVLLWMTSMLKDLRWADVQVSSCCWTVSNSVLPLAPFWDT